MEFAGIFATLGSKVTVAIRAAQVLRHFDHDIRVALAEEMTARGIEIRAHTHVTRIDKTADGLVATLKDGAKISADVILYATGRRPTTRDLGLAEVGVRLNEAEAIVIDEAQRTSVPHIYAIGDVTDRLNLTPVAIADGRVQPAARGHGRPRRACGARKGGRRRRLSHAVPADRRRRRPPFRAPHA